MSDPLMNTIVTGWLDWAFKGLVGGIAAGLLAVAAWGFNAEARLATVEKFDPRIARLEAREDGYAALTTDLAVVKAQLVAQDKQLDHITKLLESTR